MLFEIDIFDFKFGWRIEEIVTKIEQRSKHIEFLHVNLITVIKVFKVKIVILKANEVFSRDRFILH